MMNYLDRSKSSLRLGTVLAAGCGGAVAASLAVADRHFRGHIGQPMGLGDL